MSFAASLLAIKDSAWRCVPASIVGVHRVRPVCTLVEQGQTGVELRCELCGETRVAVLPEHLTWALVGPQEFWGWLGSAIEGAYAERCPSAPLPVPASVTGEGDALREIWA